MEKIKCPNCGREYFPVEIFLPNIFFGKPDNITRNDLGEIIDFGGTKMDTTENYICDGCNKPFQVETEIIFRTKKNDAIDFSKEYSTPIKKKLFLKEE